MKKSTRSRDGIETRAKALYAIATKKATTIRPEHHTLSHSLMCRTNLVYKMILKKRRISGKIKQFFFFLITWLKAFAKI